MEVSGLARADLGERSGVLHAGELAKASLQGAPPSSALDQPMPAHCPQSALLWDQGVPAVHDSHRWCNVLVDLHAAIQWHTHRYQAARLPVMSAWITTQHQQAADGAHKRSSVLTLRLGAEARAPATRRGLLATPTACIVATQHQGDEEEAQTGAGLAPRNSS